MPKTTIAETILRQKYKWRIPAFKVDADTVGEIFESIEERDGVLSPSAVVDEARPEVSPIHACFEWTTRRPLRNTGDAGFKYDPLSHRFDRAY
jgi:hypothetical protein